MIIQRKKRDRTLLDPGYQWGPQLINSEDKRPCKNLSLAKWEGTVTDAM